jgi:hypothetical protein
LSKPANLPINLIAQIAKKEKSEQEYYDNKYGFKVGRVLFNYILAKPAHPPCAHLTYYSYARGT